MDKEEKPIKTPKKRKLKIDMSKISPMRLKRIESHEQCDIYVKSFKAQTPLAQVCKTKRSSV